MEEITALALAELIEDQKKANANKPPSERITTPQIPLWLISAPDP
jgi:hypothetical protein